MQQVRVCAAAQEGKKSNKREREAEKSNQRDEVLTRNRNEGVDK